MSEDDPRRAPREVSEARSFEILASSRAEIPERVRGFLAAASMLEREAHLVASCEAKINLAEHSACGGAAYGFVAGPLLAGAVVSRLRGLLAPYLGLSPADIAQAEGLEAELRGLAEPTA